MSKDRVSPQTARPGSGRTISRERASASSRVERLAAPALRLAAKRPGFVLGAAVLLATTSAIGWNALSQGGRHPAPLFKPKAPGQAEAPRRVETAAFQQPVAIPVPVPRPDPTTVGSVVPPPAPPPPAAKPAAAPADPIGSLIRGGEASARPAEIRPDPRVMAVQKALTKLGYGPLKADGLLGSGTRQALERFERDNSLPITGGLGIRTTRQLASVSGTQIE